jgi:hypothetical protein
MVREPWRQSTSRRRAFGGQCPPVFSVKITLEQGEAGEKKQSREAMGPSVSIFLAIFGILNDNARNNSSLQDLSLFVPAETLVPVSIFAELSLKFERQFR